MDVATATAPTVDTRLVEVQRAPADSLFNLIAMAARDSTIDVAKLGVLLEMQRQLVADEAKLRFNRAMRAAQQEMVPVVRDATNDQTHSKYARLETIDVAVRPIYTRHGFNVKYNTEVIDGPNERVICDVSHDDGHTERFHLDAAPDTLGPQGKANKTALHGLGSTITYARRYLMCMAFNIVLTNEDLDGNSSANNGRVIPSGTVSQTQAAIIRDGIDRTGVHRGLFLKDCMGVKTIEEIQASDYPKAITALVQSKLNREVKWRPTHPTQARTAA